jgi:phospholipid/cholesterol/gamma-HCH transport system substrate-binding protein
MVVGAFVLIALTAFIWMLMMFGDLPVVVNRYRSYQVLINFPSAPGAQRDTPVNYCGYQIGRVFHVSPPFLFTDEAGRSFHQVKVTCLIDEKYTDIPANAEVKLMKRGLGSSYIEFFWDPVQGLPVEEPRYLQDQIVLQGSTGMVSEFFPPEVQKKLENLVDSIGALANNANEIIGNEANQSNIHLMLANVQEATAQANETLRSIRTLSDRGAEQVERVAGQVVLIANRLDAALSQLQQVIAKINAGEGTAGRLMTDGRLYENLLDSSEEMQLAIEQLKKWATDAREKGIRIKW